MVIIVEKRVGVGVREISTRRGGRDEGVDKWAIRGVFSRSQRRVFVKTREVKGMAFLRCIP